MRDVSPLAVTVVHARSFGNVFVLKFGKKSNKKKKMHDEIFRTPPGHVVVRRSRGIIIVFHEQRCTWNYIRTFRRLTSVQF